MKFSRPGNSINESGHRRFVLTLLLDIIEVRLIEEMDGQQGLLLRGRHHAKEHEASRLLVIVETGLDIVESIIQVRIGDDISVGVDDCSLEAETLFNATKLGVCPGCSFAIPEIILVNDLSAC